MKIKKGDSIKIISGKYKGKNSTVEKVFTEKNLVVAKGINIVKRHTKSQGKAKQGGIISKEMPINVSNVMFICPKCQKPTRLGYKFVSSKKYRRCVKCGEVL